MNEPDFLQWLPPGIAIQKPFNLDVMLDAVRAMLIGTTQPAPPAGPSGVPVPVPHAAKEPTPSIFCLATSRGRADRILDAIKGAALADTRIGVLFLDRNPDDDRKREREHLPPVDCSAESAGPIRGVMATLAGICRLAIPGTGSFIAAGPIVTAANAFCDSTPGASISEGLARFGFPAATAALYQRRLSNGGDIMISLHGADEVELARGRGILVEFDAQAICATGDTPAPLAGSGASAAR